MFRCPEWEDPVGFLVVIVVNTVTRVMIPFIFIYISHAEKSFHLIRHKQLTKLVLEPA